MCKKAGGVSCQVLPVCVWVVAGGVCGWEVVVCLVGGGSGGGAWHGKVVCVQGRGKGVVVVGARQVETSYAKHATVIVEYWGWLVASQLRIH